MILKVSINAGVGSTRKLDALHLGERAHLRLGVDLREPKCEAQASNVAAGLVLQYLVQLAPTPPSSALATCA